MDPAIGAAIIGGVATLVAGGGAVIAAYIVGSRQGDIASRQADIQDRQAGISERQTDIQERQVDLVDTSNRIELFERRMQVYHDAQDFLFKFAALDIGLENEIQEADDKIWRHLNESRFLFDVSIYQWMNEVIEKKSEYRFLSRAAVGAVGTPEGDQFNKQLTDLHIWSLDQLKGMPKTFSPFLTVTVKSSPREGAIAHAIRLTRTL